MNTVTTTVTTCGGPDCIRFHIATTHAQAKFVLPAILEEFSSSFPGVRFNLKHALPPQILTAVSSGEVDIGITPDEWSQANHLRFMPYKSYPRMVLVPKSHPLLRQKNITLQTLARCPIVSMTEGYPIRTDVFDVFANHGIAPDVREVLVVGTGGANCWFMGENMVHEALYSGLAGIVTDGCVRDSAELLDIALPVFSAGISLVPPLDRFAIAELDGPLEIGGARVVKGDVIHADADGVVVVVQDLLAELERNVAELAQIEAAQERAIRDRAPLNELHQILALKKGGKLKPRN